MSGPKHEIQEFLLPRSGQAALRIRGENIAAVDGQHMGGREQNRYHTLAIYRTEAGQYVVRIGYHTSWQGECGHDAAEVAATAAACGRVLRDYDPLEHVAGYPPGENYVARQERLTADITARYQALVSALLSDPIFAEDVSAAIYGAGVAERRRQLCRQLEIESLHLSRGEACGICDALNGTILDESGWQCLWAEVADADRLDGLGEKWSIDAQALAARIRDASPGAKLALAEAVEEFWRSHHERPIDEGLRAVGLLAGGE
jgi:hypothetical protein